MKTIELIEKLNGLAQLVKLFEERTPEAATQIWGESAIKKYSGKVFLRFSAIWCKGLDTHKFGHDSEWPEAFDDEFTQTAFKAKVLKVVGELIRLYPNLKRINDYGAGEFDDLVSLNTFDELFTRLLVSILNGKTSNLLHAICEKLGVELESEDLNK